jgi:hypothetical protein
MARVVVDIAAQATEKAKPCGFVSAVGWSVVRLRLFPIGIVIEANILMYDMIISMIFVDAFDGMT